MISIEELKEWVETVPDEADVYIDCGGLVLHARLGKAGCYLEVGGDPNTHPDKSPSGD